LAYGETTLAILRFVAYSMGKLANVIWNKDWDANYFLDNSTKLLFAKLIHDMYEVNPKAQKIVQHVVHMLMEPPYNWTSTSKFKVCHVGCHVMWPKPKPKF
jgi:hypothetical protein